MLLIYIDIPERFKPKAKYIFRLFSNIWGIPVKFCDNNIDIDIIYAFRNQYKQQDTCLNIPFNEDLYRDDTKCKAVDYEDRIIWVKETARLNEFDFIGSSYRLVTFMDEQQVKEEDRDRRGIFFTKSLPRPRQTVAKLPIMENHARYLFQQLRKMKPNLEQNCLPRWPNNKKYVISITHDTDAVNLGAPKEILINLIKGIARRNKTHLTMFKLGLKHFGKAANNPLFCFPVWQEWESEYSFRSAFYLYAKYKKDKFDINDCRSSVKDQRIDWNILKGMSDAGWEFGLHPSINAKSNLDSFIINKQFIEEKLQMPIFGLRHHYWALDWRRPYMTFRKHINAGFRYDTSIAWRDIPGFRAATCLPFQPFDLQRNKSLSMYELPTCLMDGHVIKNNKDHTYAIQLGQETIKTVKHYRGVAVLDWHQETAYNSLIYNNYLTVLNDILKPFLEDSEVWFATPWDIIKHWYKRAKLLTIN